MLFVKATLYMGALPGQEYFTKERLLVKKNISKIFNIKKKISYLTAIPVWRTIAPKILILNTTSDIKLTKLGFHASN